jgi:hypothetical protein
MKAYENRKPSLFIKYYKIYSFAYLHIRTFVNPLTIRFITLLICKLGLEGAVVNVEVLQAVP